MSEITVLIVEDEGIVAKDLSIRLVRLGYKVCGIAAQAHQAIQMAQDLKPGLILMDIQLDGSLDGIEAAEMIQQAQDIPVIFLTAHSDPATLARAKLTGPSGYILKPFEERELAIQIELALYKHQADRQLREQREWLRVTLTSIGDAVIATDDLGRISFLNPVAEALTGWTAHEAMGRPVAEVFRIINEQTGLAVEDPVACVLRECRTIPLANHTALVTKDGRSVPIEDSASPIMDANGRVIGVVLVFHDVTDKRRAEEELKHSRLLMSEAEKLSHTGAWQWDIGSDKWTFSDEWLSIHGCSNRTLTAEELISIAHPEDSSAIEQALAEVRMSKAPYDIEHRIVRMDDGQERIVHAYGRCIFNDDGQAVKVYGFAQDVTESRKAQKTLQASEHRWAVTLSSIGDAVIATDTAGNITFLNPVAENLTGWRIAEALGRPVTEVFKIVNETTRDPLDNPVSKVLKSGKSVGFSSHTILLQKNGGEIPIDDSGAIIRNIDGHIIGVVLVFRDISDRRQAEKAQEKSKQRLALLAQVAERLLRSENPQEIAEDLCRSVMAHIDCQFFFYYLVKEPGKQMQLTACAGIPEEAASTFRYLDFGVTVCGCVAQEGRRIIVEDIQNRDDLRTELVKSLGVHAYCCHPLIIQDRLIGTLSFGSKTRPVFTDDEVDLMRSVSDQVAVAMQRMLAQKELQKLNESLGQQVSERTRQAETRSKQLQALAADLIEGEERERRRIADLLHDDLQQMLAAAGMQLESVCQSQPNEPNLKNVRQLLEESIAKSRRLSHELSPPVLRHANLSAALEWMAQYFKDNFGLQVELKIKATHTFENLQHKIFLFRAVQELLFNTFKHAGVTSAFVTLAAADGFLSVTVSDQGRGIDPNILDAQKPSRGLGLLSISERAHYIGGNLMIESSPKQGSRITLNVPMGISIKDATHPFEANQQPDKSAQHEMDIEAGVIRVLFVDDHKVMRQGLINLIGAQPNIRVAGEASNGREAIDRVRQLKPDVVVMDVFMPEVDGIEATRQIKTNWPQVRVIALSMVEDEQISRDMIEAGAEAFISKNVSSSDLLKAIYGK
jgi:PAS domain S-box-containing protein